MAKEVKEIVEQESAYEPILENGCICEAVVSELALKIRDTKGIVLDKIAEGVQCGVSIEHCLMLSDIYRNLCQ